MPFDPYLIAALHPLVVAGAELDQPEPHHAAFQTSTIEALLHGAYEGDLTIRALLAHGDLGLGTVDHLDGELIVVDGEAWAARVDGSLRRLAADERTPFAVVTRFDAQVEHEIATPIDHGGLVALVERLAGDATGARSLRIDGVLDVHARSVPRQDPPYRPLTEIVGEQQVFELKGVEGTLVGFRFPTFAGGVEVPGYHLHAIAADRSRGGHVLAAGVRRGTLRIGQLTDLHMELPPGVALPEGPGDSDAIDRVEH